MKPKKKVLIITYYWPPSGGSGVQRWVKFAKYLRDFGWEPVIYTAKNPDYPLLDADMGKELPEDLQVIRRSIWEPYKFANWFAKQKKEDRMGFVDTSENKSFLKRLVLWIRANCFIPDARMFWIRPSARFLIKYLKQNPVDAIVSTGPPHSMHLIAKRIQKKLGIPWLADFRDPWKSMFYLQQFPLSKASKRKHQKLEKSVLDQADAITTISETTARELGEYGKPISVIYNGHDLADKPKNNNLDTKFSIVHTGILNGEQNPQILWKVLAQMTREDTAFAQKLKIKLIGVISNEVMISIKKQGLQKYLETPGYVSHQKVYQYQSKAQLLILPVNKVDSARGIIKGKLFEYLAVNRPILAIGPPDGDLAEIVENCTAGKTFDHTAEIEIKQYLKQAFKKFEKQALAGTTQNASAYSRKNLTKKIADLLTEISN